ncbi:hypothetical protein QE152_g32687 [Popillia japonica]|uniref:Uncharacterized protein n=1 Tax=Popillia japonica TaxID=7064 RepID=A0AAW1IY53_POPJA
MKVSIKSARLIVEAEKGNGIGQVVGQKRNVSQRRLNTIAKKVIDGTGVVDRRGGDRRSHKNADKLMKVKEFISKLKGHESHYGRAKSRRIYLSSEYNIAVLWKIFNNNTEEKFNVNYKYFSRVFNNHFNIGFASPATDVCGYCVRTLTQISICKEPREKQKLKTELQVHKVRAKNFHKLMKEQPADTTSYCFDLQQVQPLPKVPIQDAFYSQQVSFYCLCITENTDIKNPVFYTWLETEAKRGILIKLEMLYRNDDPTKKLETLLKPGKKN